MNDLPLRIKLGQRLVAGFPGTVMDEEFIRVVKEYKVGNVIIFQHNIVDDAQLKTLCAELTTLITRETGFAPFITIDQEGGVVTRLSNAYTNAPGQMAIAATGDPQNAYEMGRMTAAQLRDCGVNFNLAPDLDVNCNPDNPVIGVRSFGDDPDTVARYGVRMIHGLMDGGVYAVVKHFPGHGDTAVDSHVGLPCIDKSFAELSQMEFVPFLAGIKAGVPAVMTTHILFPQLEKERLPATMSRAIMTGILRGRLGFGGLIISDCMEMEAIASYYGTVTGVLAALNAGVDLVFTSHHAAYAAQAIERAEQEIAQGKLSLAELDASVARILHHKRMCAAMQPKDAMPEGEWAPRAAAVRAGSITAVRLPAGGIPPLGEDPIFISCPDYRSTLASSASSSGFTFAEEMRKKAGFGAALVTPKDPTDDDIAATLRQAKGRSAIVLGTYNGHILKGQLRQATALAALGIPMIAVAMRNPYDLADLPGGVAALAAWEYTLPMFDALWPVISGQRQPTGVLPLKRLR